MKTDTAEKIVGYIATNKQARAHDIGRIFNIGQPAVHRQLKKLVEQGKLQKIGKPPLVFYLLKPKAQTATIIGRASILSASTIEYINKNYLYITPQGEMLYGMEGFTVWVKSIKEDVRIVPLSEEYVRTYSKAEASRSPEGWIDATSKLSSTFSDNAITKLFYGDFYSIPKFGKTKLGNLVLYSKQSQNRELIDRAVDEVKPVIERIISIYNINTIAFAPPSLPRKLQFMQEFADKLNINLPKIQLAKSYKGEIIVAQKSLTGLEERITNARETIFLKSVLPLGAQNILLIDDAVGSGATLNEIAKKLHPGNLNKKTIVGFAIVGSIKGFEVIREV